MSTELANIKEDINNMADNFAIILPTEVEKISRSLKLNKACGYDSISSELFKYASNTPYLVLSRLFSAMLFLMYRPENLKCGVIPKGNKDQSDPNNSRGITLLSTLSKVYDKLLLKRYEHWYKDKLSALQDIADDCSSSLTTALILHETIANNNGATYGALLDVQKAFDSVWINGMLYKLLQLGMDRRLWAIIFDSYTDFRCAVNIDGVLSEWFSPSQGVHQGDVMSMYLYCIYNNDLLEELLDVACPLKINNHILTCPAFADDVAIVSKSSASLQHKVDIAKCHSRKWRYNLSIAKIRIAVAWYVWICRSCLYRE